MRVRIVGCLLLLILALPVAAQSTRPLPYPVLLPASFQHALERGTRTTTGKPGPKYWTNRAEYRIEAELVPDSALLRGRETVRYFNNSPDTLRTIRLHVLQNIFREGAMRNRAVRPTGGMIITDVRQNGNPSAQQTAGTIMTVALQKPLLPGSSTELSFSWHFKVPDRGMRMGHNQDLHFIAYWYPQIAVFDDVEGWNIDQYMGAGEFYMGYADYDVRITAPQGWLVTATGELQNEADVLAPAVRERLRKVSGKSVSHIVAESEAGKATTSSSGRLTWHYRATNVRDFVFGSSPRYLWDATMAAVGDRNGDGRTDSTHINSFYRPEQRAWTTSAASVKYAVEFMSREFLPYPWPHMTAVEGAGVMGGGMEYPMMTLIGGASSERSLFGVTAHETAHMWFPMIVGTDEKQFAWIDEGLTSLNTAFMDSLRYGDPISARLIPQYVGVVNSGREVEMMRHVDETSVSDGMWSFAAYNKPVIVFNALRNLYGHDRFMQAYRAFAERWAFKHPTAYDLFNTFEDVLGEDLDWFWTPMFFETWTLDQAVGQVTNSDNRVQVTIEDRGMAPMPAPVRVTYEGGRTETRTVPVKEWLSGKRQVVLTFPGGRVTAVVIDPNRILPDVSRENNTWKP